MEVYQFPCPSCSARLRVRDRSYVGRTVNCPDCEKPLLVETGPDGALRGRLATEAPAKKTSVKLSAEEPPSPATAEPAPTGAAGVRSRSLWNRIRSPAGVGWLAAGLAFAVVFFVIFRGADEGPAGDADDRSTTVATDTDRPVNTDRPEDPAADARAAELMELQLGELGEWITGYREEHRRFPAAPSVEGDLPAAERLGWIAPLVVERSPDGVRPLWDQAWHDPLNDRFVRQRIDPLLNPAVSEIVGAAGYPATHFAGVAGVGADAPSLPFDHGRAGIFGSNRTTHFEDVVDGLSSTMMVAGVLADFGSWASGGTATTRGFAAEPYVNGPDGFGTGQQDGMFVLMADGSVRFLSTETDPVLIRRMAAMADGLPLDASVPGEPGEKRALPVRVADAMPQNEQAPHQAEDDPNGNLVDADDADDQPIDVLMAPDAPLFDVAAALEQRIVEMVQERPVPAAVLLQQIEELAGVPIDASAVFDAGAEGTLETPVTLSLIDTTVEGALQAVLEQAGLSYTAGLNGIALVVPDDRNADE